MLTFLEVGFGGNLVQGFRVYAWRAVPSLLQIALCFPSLALWPQPFSELWPVCWRPCWCWWAALVRSSLGPWGTLEGPGLPQRSTTTLTPTFLSVAGRNIWGDQAPPHRNRFGPIFGFKFITRKIPTKVSITRFYPNGRQLTWRGGFRKSRRWKPIGGEISS